MCNCAGSVAYEPCDPTAIGGAPGGLQICTVSAGGGGGAPDVIWNCDLGANDEAVPATMYMVLNSGDGDHEAWGTDGAGSDFCCTLHTSFTSAAILATRIQGTQNVDTIAHQFTDSMAVVWNHDSPNMYTTVRATANGHQDDDVIDGSEAGGQLYHEWLNGDEDGDEINGHGHGDRISGGSGGDTIDGGDGIDNISGDAGYDIIFGGDESGVDPVGDTIDGGSEGDVIFGGTKEDTIIADDFEMNDGNVETIAGGADTNQHVTDGDGDIWSGFFGSDLSSVSCP